MFLFVQFTNVSCVRLARQAVAEQPKPSLVEEQSPAKININTATAEELQRLPGIGKAFSARIIEYREKNGPFRRVEHLMMVRGISERRFRELRGPIRVD
jgi:competence protein ComEA